MNAAKKQEHARFLDFRKFREKQMARFRSGPARFFDTERRDFFLRAIKPERLPCPQPFFFGGKDHPRSIAQHPIITPRPVEPFFQMFEREGALEPGIEHAVWENEIGRRAFVKPLPHRKAVMLPDAMDDDASEFVAVFLEPLREAARVTITGQALAETVHGKRLITQPGRVRFIQCHDLGLHALLLQSPA